MQAAERMQAAAALERAGGAAGGATAAGGNSVGGRAYSAGAAGGARIRRVARARLDFAMTGRRVNGGIAVADCAGGIGRGGGGGRWRNSVLMAEFAHAFSVAVAEL